MLIAGTGTPLQRVAPVASGSAEDDWRHTYSNRDVLGRDRTASQEPHPPCPGPGAEKEGERDRDEHTPRWHAAIVRPGGALSTT